MTTTLFTNVMIWDASGREPFSGEVLVKEERIHALSEEQGKIRQEGTDVVDGGGATLMPGLVEGHAHISYRGRETTFADLGAIPAEEQTLISMHNGGSSGMTPAHRDECGRYSGIPHAQLRANESGMTPTLIAVTNAPCPS